jgi:CRP-like cAMP-binding protein
MPDLSTRNILEHNFLFHGLPESTLTAICDMARRRHVGKETMLFCQGDECDGLYGVASGQVRIYASDSSGHEVFLNIIGPGETIGEISLIDGLPRSAGAVTTDRSTLVHIPRGRFLARLEQDATLSLHVMQLLCDRLRWVSRVVEESAFLSGSARLANRLAALAERYGRPLPDGETELVISQLELSQFLGVSRQIVNQHLGELCAEGRIRTQRGRIVVPDLAALSSGVEPLNSPAEYA